MKASRDFTNIVNYILDNLCPPVLRDCYLLMYPIYRVAYGKTAAKLMKYKDNYAFLSDEEYAEYYRYAAKAAISQRSTDINRAGVRFILENMVRGGTWLDAGCGRGWLAKRLAAEGCTTTGIDIAVPSDYTLSDGYSFVAGYLEAIPFPDGHFDTVVCAHVLEHVRDFDKVLQELLRVTKQRLIIVLPRQREYRYVADLHIRYFPYLYNVQLAIPLREAKVIRIGSDWGILVIKHEHSDKGDYL